MAPFFLVIGGNSPHSIFVPPGGPPPVAFAAEELQKYVEQMSGVCLPIATATDKPLATVIRIAPDMMSAPATAETPELAKDAFRLVVSATGVSLVGSNPRAALYAAYELLERLGCRWFLPGEDGEYVPTGSDLSLAVSDGIETPAFHARGMTEDSKAAGDDPFWQEQVVHDARLFLDWMAKNRMNQYRIRLEVRQELAAEFERRGIDPPYGGGHSIPGMLPAALFDEHPEYFRMDQTGQRVPNGNVCVSHPETLRLCAEHVMAWFREHPDAEWYLVMGEDIWGGAWCSCDGCRPYTPTEQNILLINAIQDALRAAGMQGRCAYAAYRDTLRCDLHRVRPDPEVRIGYAPRERSYGHSLADLASERNRWFMDNLRAWRRKHSGDLGVVDYYHDCILFYSYAVPTTGIITEDMRTYRDLDAGGVRSFMMGRFSWYAYGPSLYIFSRLAWDPDLDTEHLLDELAHLHYGPAALEIRGYWRELERGMARFQTLGEIETLPITTDPIMEQIMADFAAGLASLDKAAAHLQAALAQVAETPYAGRVELEERVYRITRAAAEALYHQLHGNYWTAVARRDDDMNAIRSGMGNRPPRPVRGVGYAVEQLTAARDRWQQHTDLLRELDPEPGSYWVQGPGGGPNGLNHRTILLLDRQIQQVQAMGASVPGEG